MWQCTKCGELIDEPFDACWSCGTSKDGVEQPAFHAEVDVVETPTVGRTSRRWNGFLAGAALTWLVGYVDFVVPYLVAMPGNSRIRDRLAEFLLAAAVWSLMVAVGGGIAGWIGSRTNRLVTTALKGALIVLVFQAMIIIFTSSPFAFFKIPLPRIVAILINLAALGAIAGCAGKIFGRSRQQVDTTEEPVQYSLAEMLFITMLFGFLFGSLAFLIR